MPGFPEAVGASPIPIGYALPSGGVLRKFIYDSPLFVTWAG